MKIPVSGDFRQKIVNFFLCRPFPLQFCPERTKLTDSNLSKRRKVSLLERFYDILCCQSPGLFLAALALLLRFFTLRKTHKLRSGAALAGAMLFLAGGVGLYFYGMYRELFTIRDFFRLRPAGWAGLGVVLAVILLLLFNGMKNRASRKKLARAEAQAQQDKQAALEQAVEQTMRQTRDCVRQEEQQRRLDQAWQRARQDADAALGQDAPISLTLEPEQRPDKSKK